MRAHFLSTILALIACECECVLASSHSTSNAYNSLLEFKWHKDYGHGHVEHPFGRWSPIKPFDYFELDLVHLKRALPSTPVRSSFSSRAHLVDYLQTFYTACHIPGRAYPGKPYATPARFDEYWRGGGGDIAITSIELVARHISIALQNYHWAWFLETRYWYATIEYGRFGIVLSKHDKRRTSIEYAYKHLLGDSNYVRINGNFATTHTWAEVLYFAAELSASFSAKTYRATGNMFPSVDTSGSQQQQQQIDVDKNNCQDFARRLGSFLDPSFNISDKPIAFSPLELLNLTNDYEKNFFPEIFDFS